MEEHVDAQNHASLHVIGRMVDVLEKGAGTLSARNGWIAASTQWCHTYTSGSTLA